MGSKAVLPLDFSEPQSGPYVSIQLLEKTRRLLLRDLVAFTFVEGGRSMLPFIEGTVVEPPFRVVNVNGRLHDCRVSNIAIQ